MLLLIERYCRPEFKIVHLACQVSKVNMLANLCRHEYVRYPPSNHPSKPHTQSLLPLMVGLSQEMVIDAMSEVLVVVLDELTSLGALIAPGT